MMHGIVIDDDFGRRGRMRRGGEKQVWGRLSSIYRFPSHQMVGDALQWGHLCALRTRMRDGGFFFVIMMIGVGKLMYECL